MRIYEALNEIMQETKAITKKKKSEQGYKYRGVDQVLNQLQPILAKHGVIVVPTVLETTREQRKTVKGKDVTYSIMKIKYTFYATDGSNVECIVVGEAMDSGDKASNKCMSVAFKYACFQVLCIPTEETTADPDDSNDELKAPKTFLCEQCGAKIGTWQTPDGKKVSASRMYDTSKKKYGKALCISCVNKLKNENKQE